MHRLPGHEFLFPSRGPKVFPAPSFETEEREGGREKGKDEDKEMRKREEGKGEKWRNENEEGGNRRKVNYGNEDKRKGKEGEREF